jgi:hypothetical protein
MGIDFYIGEDQVRITNATWFNRFLNWVAEKGNYPQILNHSPVHGRYRVQQKVPPTLYDGSVLPLLRELEELKRSKPPEWANDIIDQMRIGCRKALDTSTDITLDDGAWYGS